jgi:hypothetical protein
LPDVLVSGDLGERPIGGHLAAVTGLPSIWTIGCEARFQAVAGTHPCEVRARYQTFARWWHRAIWTSGSKRSMAWRSGLARRFVTPLRVVTGTAVMVSHGGAAKAGCAVLLGWATGGGNPGRARQLPPRLRHTHSTVGDCAPTCLTRLGQSIDVPVALKPLMLRGRTGIGKVPKIMDSRRIAQRWSPLSACPWLAALVAASTGGGASMTNGPGPEASASLGSASIAGTGYTGTGKPRRARRHRSQRDRERSIG